MAATHSAHLRTTTAANRASCSSGGVSSGCLSLDWPRAGLLLSAGLGAGVLQNEAPVRVCGRLSHLCSTRSSSHGAAAASARGLERASGCGGGGQIEVNRAVLGRCRRRWTIGGTERCRRPVPPSIERRRAAAPLGLAAAHCDGCAVLHTARSVSTEAAVSWGLHCTHLLSPGSVDSAAH